MDRTAINPTEWGLQFAMNQFFGTTKPPADAEGFEERTTLWAAGARYAQRCPVEFGVPMEAAIAQ